MYIFSKLNTYGYVYDERKTVFCNMNWYNEDLAKSNIVKKKYWKVEQISV